jgi:hypothetical protein
VNCEAARRRLTVDEPQPSGGPTEEETSAIAEHESAFGTSTVILVVGAQKIVGNLHEAFRRIEDYCPPFEDQRAQRVYGTPSGINKLLILKRNPMAAPT